MFFGLVKKNLQVFLISLEILVKCQDMFVQFVTILS